MEEIRAFLRDPDEEGLFVVMAIIAILLLGGAYVTYALSL